MAESQTDILREDYFHLSMYTFAETLLFQRLYLVTIDKIEMGL